MKKLNLKVIFILFLLAFLNINCSPHCDDEDYTREQNEAVIHYKDSLAISIN